MVVSASRLKGVTKLRKGRPLNGPLNGVQSRETGGLEPLLAKIGEGILSEPIPESLLEALLGYGSLHT